MIITKNEEDLIIFGKSLMIITKYHSMINNINEFVDDNYYMKYADSIESYFNKKFIRIIINNFNELNEDERMVIYNKIFCSQNSSIEISRKFFMSRSTLYRRYNHGLKKLAQLFLEKYY